MQESCVVLDPARTPVGSSIGNDWCMEKILRKYSCIGDFEQSAVSISTGHGLLLLYSSLEADVAYLTSDCLDSSLTIHELELHCSLQ